MSEHANSRFAVVSDPEAAYEFCCRFFPYQGKGEFKGLCLLRDGDPIAAVIFDNYNGSNVFMHVAAVPGKKWLNRHFLHESFKHPFVTLGCRRITGWTEKSNVVARKFNHHLGFEQEAILERAAEDGGDVVIYRMFRENCRYA